MATHGHTVLRLPPYHPDLNPIELIWGDIKQWVAGNNTTFQLDDVKRLLEERVSAIGVKEWEKVCDHTEKIEREYFQKEGIVEDALDEFVIRVSEDSDDASSESDTDAESEGDLSGIEPLSD